MVRERGATRFHLAQVGYSVTDADTGTEMTV